jgi:hypothetical protein
MVNSFPSFLSCPGQERAEPGLAITHSRNWEIHFAHSNRNRDITLLTSWTNPYRESLQLHISFNQPYPRRWGHRLLDRTWNRHVVKSRDVFPHQFSTQPGGEIAQVPGYDLAGMGPGRVAVGEVVGPHAVVGSPPRQDMAPDSVVKESGVDLAVEIFARKFFYCEAFALGSMALEVVVPLFE